MIISKKCTFDAAHHLPGYPGKCKNLHGHTFFVEVSVMGDKNQETGMVVDFKDLSDFLKNNVVEAFDHNELNKFFRMPTAENIAQFILAKLYFWCANKNIDPYSVKVWETPDSCVEIRC